MPRATLTPKQAAFVAEYLVDLNATQAAIRAGYSAKTADAIGKENLGKPPIAQAIAAAKANRAQRVEITADAVLQQLWALANADPNELVEHRRTCCRHCHGNDFEYQETVREQEARRRERLAAWERRKNPKPTDVFEFDEMGGDGYDGRLPPVPECPHCHGLGVERTVVKDTRWLSPAARRLYAGVKQTKDGVEVKMHDQFAALVKCGEHVGAFKGGPNASVNLNIDFDQLTDAQLEHLANGGTLATLPR